MNKTLQLILLTVVGIVMTGCYDDNNYAYQLSKEKKEIDSYISRENLHILHTLPEADSLWGEKDYYDGSAEYDDNFYFHLIRRGDTIEVDESGDTIPVEAVRAGQSVVVRYKKFVLTEGCDTIESNWSTLDSPTPTTFVYKQDYTTGCKGLHAAVEMMKYPGSQCLVIVPSKMGTNSDMTRVTPYGYKVELKGISH